VDNTVGGELHLCQLRRLALRYEINLEAMMRKFGQRTVLGAAAVALTAMAFTGTALAVATLPAAPAARAAAPTQTA